MDIIELKEQYIQMLISYRKKEKLAIDLQKSYQDIDYMLFLRQSENKHYKICNLVALIAIIIGVIFASVYSIHVSMLFLMIGFNIFSFKKAIDTIIRKAKFKSATGHKCDKHLLELRGPYLLYNQIEIEIELSEIKEKMLLIQKQAEEILRTVSDRNLFYEQAKEKAGCIIIDDLERFKACSNPFIIEDTNKDKQKSKR